MTRFSGRVLGAHQKINRVSRKHLNRLMDDELLFPSIRQILYFEGKNGPDGIKRKSPAKDEPWHYYSPFKDEDTQLIELIQDHYGQLIKELTQGNRERAAFEAAWLSHAIVDGLTPAHHYPYEEKLMELRGGKGIETRTSLKEKLLMHGSTPFQKVLNNWKMWGSKGLMTTHGTFELGIASLIAPLSFLDALPSETELIELEKVGIVEVFKRAAREIAVLDLYGRYYEKGWTPLLAYEVRHKLGPRIVQTVTLAWYDAWRQAGLAEQRA